MRIVIAGQTYHPAANGQAVFTVRLAEGLARAGHEVAAAIPSHHRDGYRTVLNGVRVEAMGAFSLAPRHPDVYVTLFPDARLGRLLDDFQPDVVHIQDHFPISRVAVRLARQRGIPLVGTNHFLPENVIPYLPAPAWSRQLLNRLLWITMLDVFNRVDVATTPTETAAGLLRQQSIRVPVHAVSCGVDLNRFHPDPAVDRSALRRRYGLDPNRTVFLFVGRVDQEKRLDVLLQALVHLDRCDLQLAIAGRGRHLHAFQALARELALDDRVVFTGYVSPQDLVPLLNSVDIFAMPSEAELQSIATLEAMASGRPVLAADARALPELVRDGVNGYLFRPGDPHHAASRMAQLIAERDRWAEMGAASLARASVHGLAHTLFRYEELYRGLSRARQPLAQPQWYAFKG